MGHYKSNLQCFTMCQRQVTMATTVMRRKVTNIKLVPGIKLSLSNFKTKNKYFCRLNRQGRCSGFVTSKGPFLNFFIWEGAITTWNSCAVVTLCFSEITHMWSMNSTFGAFLLCLYWDLLSITISPYSLGSGRPLENDKHTYSSKFTSCKEKTEVGVGFFCHTGAT